MSINVTNKQFSATEVNDICTHLHKLGRKNSEWLDASGAFPIVRKKSRSLFARIWKPENLRVVPAFNNAVRFFKKHKEKLADAQYAKSNIDGLLHVYHLFSTKRHAKLQLQNLMTLIEEITSKEQPLTEKPEEILSDAQEKCGQMKQKSQREYDQALERCEAQEKIAQVVNDSAKRRLEKVKQDAVDRVEPETKNIESYGPKVSEALQIARANILRNPFFHDVHLRTRSATLSTHSVFLNKVLKKPILITGTSQIGLDIFENFDFSVISRFCKELYIHDKDFGTLKFHAEYVVLLDNSELQISVMQEAYSSAVKSLQSRVDSCNDLNELIEVYLYLLQHPEGEKIANKVFKDKIIELVYKLQLSDRLEVSRKAINSPLLIYLLVKPRDIEDIGLLNDFEIEMFLQCFDSFRKGSYVPNHFEWMYHLLMLNNRRRVKGQEKESFEYLEKQTDDLSIYTVAMCYFYGKGVECNINKTYEILLKEFETKNLYKDKLREVLYHAPVRRCSYYIQFYELCWEREKRDYTNEFLCRDRIGLANYYMLTGGNDNLNKAIEILQEMINKASAQQIVELAMKQMENIPIEYINDRANSGHEIEMTCMIDFFYRKLSTHAHLITEKTTEWLNSWSNNVNLKFHGIKAKFILAICKTQGWGTALSRGEGLVELMTYNPHLISFHYGSKYNYQVPYAVVTLYEIFGSQKEREIFQIIVSFLFHNKELLKLEEFQNSRFFLWLTEIGDETNAKSIEQEDCIVMANWLRGECYYQGVAKCDVRKDIAKGHFKNIIEGYKSKITYNKDLYDTMLNDFNNYKF